MFPAQRDNPSDGDFIQLVQNDLRLIGETFDERKTRSFNKKEFKKYNKPKIGDVIFDYIKSQQSTHSKTKHIVHNQFKTQRYMNDLRLTNKMVSLLFNMRSSMVRGVKKNFSSWYRGSFSCPLSMNVLHVVYALYPSCSCSCTLQVLNMFAPFSRSYTSNI